MIVFIIVLIVIAVVLSILFCAAAAILNAGQMQDEDHMREDEEQIHYIEDYNRKKAEKKRSS